MLSHLLDRVKRTRAVVGVCSVLGISMLLLGACGQTRVAAEISPSTPASPTASDAKVRVQIMGVSPYEKNKSTTPAMAKRGYKKYVLVSVFFINDGGSVYRDDLMNCVRLVHPDGSTQRPIYAPGLFVYRVTVKPKGNAGGFWLAFLGTNSYLSKPKSAVIMYAPHGDVSKGVLVREGE